MGSQPNARPPAEDGDEQGEPRAVDAARATQRRSVAGRRDDLPSETDSVGVWVSRSCAQGTVMSELDGPPDPTASTWKCSRSGHDS